MKKFFKKNIDELSKFKSEDDLIKYLNSSLIIKKGSTEWEKNKLDDFKKIFFNTNINCLLGAGFSYYFDEKTKFGMPIMKILYDDVFDEKDLGESLIDISNNINDKKMQDEINFSISNKDLEKLIDFLYDLDGTNEFILKLKKKILNILLNYYVPLINDYKSDAENPVLEHYYSFFELISLITSEKNNYTNTVNIFTTNYDNLSELALEKIGKNYYNGFMGIFNRTFNSDYYNFKYFNEINMYDYKYSLKCDFFNIINLHGSFSWTVFESPHNKLLVENREIFMQINEETLPNNLMLIKPKIIYPSYKKFREVALSKEFFDLQVLLKNKLNLEKSSLLVLGNSLGDYYISKTVFEAQQYSKLSVIIFCFNEEEYISFKSKMEPINFSQTLFVFMKNKNMSCNMWVTFLIQLFKPFLFGDYDE